MKFEIELELEEGDIIIFNDEVWRVDGFGGLGRKVDIESVGTGRLECFSEEDLQKNIGISGKFSRIKKDYVKVFYKDV